MIAISHRVIYALNDFDDRQEGYHIPQPSDKQIRQTFDCCKDSNADNPNKQSADQDLPDRKLTGKSIINSQIMRHKCSFKIKHKKNRRAGEPETKGKMFSVWIVLSINSNDGKYC